MRYVGLVSDVDGNRTTVSTEDSVRVELGWVYMQFNKEMDKCL